ncbi:MAG: TolB family protein, partial [Gemmatimonadaceae bacterium]
MARRLILAAIAATFSTTLTAQAPDNRLTLASYLEWEDAQSPQLSPDGKQIIYTRRWIDKLNDRWESSLWIMNVDGTKNRSLTQGGDVQWSPDGSRIAYIARGEPSGSQIFVRWMDAEGATSQITRLTESPSNIRWSPDSKTIAFNMNVPYRESWAIPMPQAPKGAKWTEAPRIVTRLDYRQDRQGFNDDAYSHIFLVSAEGGTPRQVTSGSWSHGSPEWLPDGKTIVFSSDRVPESEYRWRQSDVYSVDVPTGKITQLTRRSGPDGSPQASPDGKLIAYTGVDSSDASYIDQELYVMNADGSNSRHLTASLDRSPQGLIWARDGSGIYVSVDSEGSRNLHFVSLTGQVRQITKGAQVLSVSDIGANGLVVGTVSTTSAPNDVVSFTL